MRSRQEIKADAKQAAAAQRGTVIIVIFLAALVGGLIGLVSVIPVIGWLVMVAGTFVIVALSVNIFGMFISVYRNEHVEVAEPFTNIAANFLRKVGGMYWMALWSFLWSLLLYIPGIIKTIAYSMTPYILADCPNVTAKDALKLSMRMTNGHKADIFVLGLSFFGWILLSGLTFGILYIVYVGPYMYTTFAGYYLELKEKAIASGAVTAAEFA